MADERAISAIEQAKQRNAEAFLAVVQKYLYVIRAALARYIQNIRGYEEEDIIKMVILAAWEKIADLRGGEESFKCWLSRKTHWICLDLLRAQKKTGAMIPVESLADHHQECPPDPSPTILEIMLTEEKRSIFEGAINTLPEVYRQALSLRYQGLEYADIADVLAIDIKTVGSRLNRGIKLIRAHLTQQGFLD